MNTDLIVVFRGVADGSIQRKWIFNNNCILPFDQQYFKDDSIDLYEQTGSNIVTFNDAFQNECTLPTSGPSEESSSLDDENLNESSSSLSSDDVFDNSESNILKTNSEDTTFQPSSFQGSFSYSLSYSLTFILRKSVSFSFSYSFSNIFIINTENEELILSRTISLYFLPYIIYYLSPSYISQYIPLLLKKARITSEQLIGITCGSAAVFFFVLYLIIVAVRGKKKQIDLYEWTISDEDLNDEKIDENKNIKNLDSLQESDDDPSSYIENFWF